MKLSAPKNVTFYVALALGVLGFLFKVFNLGGATLADNAFWFAFVGFLVLVAANLLPDL